MEMAPIVPFVYKRADHTRQTLEALSKCSLAKDSLLVVYADGPKADATAQQKAQIDET